MTLVLYCTVASIAAHVDVSWNGIFWDRSKVQVYINIFQLVTMVTISNLFPYEGIPYLSFFKLNSIESTESIELVENYF